MLLLMKNVKMVRELADYLTAVFKEHTGINIWKNMRFCIKRRNRESINTGHNDDVLVFFKIKVQQQNIK